MDAAVREFVRQRAGNRCEYCRIPQSSAPFFTFHIEHIRAKQHRGGDEPGNLALACPDCNAFKSPNLTTYTPDTDELVPVFNPRSHTWDEHFVFQGPLIFGTTPIGRGTVELLKLTNGDRVEVRAELIAHGRF